MRSESRFSMLAFLAALVTVGGGAALGLRYVPTVGTYVGILAGGLLVGLALEHRPTVESGVAAVLAGFGLLVVGALSGNGVIDAVLAVSTTNPLPVLVGAVLSFAVGAFGGHFGDDLRDGLTEPLSEPAPAPSRPRSVRRSDVGDGVETTDGERRTETDDQPEQGGDRDQSSQDAEESSSGSGFEFDADVEADEEREYELE